MKWPFVSRRRYDAVYADRERLRGERNQFRDDRDSALAAARTAARQLVAADAANRRLHDRNLELGRRVTALAESDLEYAAQLERRVARLKKVGKRVLAAWAREQRRAEHLQQRLDNACGLNPPAVEACRHWQATRTDGGRKGVAS
jgi:hypothetical protein